MSTKNEKEWASRCKSLQKQQVDQVHLLNSRHQHKVNLLNTMKEFIKKKGELDFSYGTSLDRLANVAIAKLQGLDKQGPYGVVLSENLESLEDKTVYNAFNKCLQEHITMSQARCEYATGPLIQVHDSIGHLITEAETAHKKTVDCAQRIHTQIIESMNNISTLQRQYEVFASEESGYRDKVDKVSSKAEVKGLKDNNKKTLKRTNTSKTIKELDKFKVRLKNTEEKTSLSRNELLLALRGFNCQYGTFHNKSSHELIEAMEYHYTKACQETIAMYVKSTNSLGKKNEQSRNDIQTAMDSVTEANEISSIIKGSSFLEAEGATFASFSKTEPNYLTITEHDDGQQLKKKAQDFETSLNLLGNVVEKETDILEALERNNASHMALASKNLQFNITPVLIGQICEKKLAKCERSFELERYKDLTRHIKLALDGKREPIVKLRQTGRPSNTMRSPSVVSQTSKSSLRHRMFAKDTIKKDSKQRKDSVPLFGGTISQHVDSSHLVPKIVCYCCKAVEKHGIATRGIYRMSGGVGEINQLKAQFENGDPPLGGEEPEGDVIHVVAGTLKCYLRELQEPLMSFELYDEFIQCGNMASSPERVERLIEVIKKLPQSNYHTVAYLIRSLARIAANSDENKMIPSNLGVVFGPTILNSNQENALEASLRDANAQSNVVEDMVKNVDTIFDVGPNIAASISTSSSAIEYDSPDLAEASEDNDDNKSDNSHKVETFSTSSVQSHASVEYETVSNISVIKQQRDLEGGSAGEENDSEEDDNDGDDNDSLEIIQVKVVYPYDANADDELDLVEGEIIDIYDSTDKIWWVGEKNGIKGMVPREYVDIITSETPPSPVATVATFNAFDSIEESNEEAEYMVPFDTKEPKAVVTIKDEVEYATPYDYSDSELRQQQPQLSQENDTIDTKDDDVKKDNTDTFIDTNNDTNDNDKNDNNDDTSINNNHNQKAEVFNDTSSVANDDTELYDNNDIIDLVNKNMLTGGGSNIKNDHIENDDSECNDNEECDSDNDNDYVNVVNNNNLNTDYVNVTQKKKKNNNKNNNNNNNNNNKDTVMNNNQHITRTHDNNSNNINSNTDSIRNNDISNDATSSRSENMNHGDNNNDDSNNNNNSNDNNNDSYNHSNNKKDKGNPTDNNINGIPDPILDDLTPPDLPNSNLLCDLDLPRPESVFDQHGHDDDVDLPPPPVFDDDDTDWNR